MKEDLFGKIRLFVHVCTFVWMHLHIHFQYKHSFNKRLFNPKITKYDTKVSNTNLLLARELKLSHFAPEFVYYSIL